MASIAFRSDRAELDTVSRKPQRLEKICMSGSIGPAKCLRCGNADAIRIRDGMGWQVSCPICGFLEIYDYWGKRAGYRRECPLGIARYIRRDRQGPDSGRHHERFFSEMELQDALARIRSRMESGDVYWESVLVTAWREHWNRVEFMMGSPECLNWEPPARADVPLDADPLFPAPVGHGKVAHPNHGSSL